MQYEGPLFRKLSFPGYATLIFLALTVIVKENIFCNKYMAHAYI